MPIPAPDERINRHAQANPLGAGPHCGLQGDAEAQRRPDPPPRLDQPGRQDPLREELRQVARGSRPPLAANAPDNDKRTRIIGCVCRYRVRWAPASGEVHPDAKDPGGAGGECEAELGQDAQPGGLQGLKARGQGGPGVALPLVFAGEQPQREPQKQPHHGDREHPHHADDQPDRHRAARNLLAFQGPSGQDQPGEQAGHSEQGSHDEDHPSHGAFDGEGPQQQRSNDQHAAGQHRNHNTGSPHRNEQSAHHRHQHLEVHVPSLPPGTGAPRHVEFHCAACNTKGTE